MEFMTVFSRKKIYSLRRQEEMTAYLFILPFLVGFTVIQIIPFLSTFVISFTNIRYFSDLENVRFVGIENFIDFFNDKSSLEAMGRTLYYSLLFVPTLMIMSLLFAILIKQKIACRNVIRTMIFMPYVSNIAAIALVWAILFDYRDGPINVLLRGLGMTNPPMWLMGVNTVIPSIVIILVWQGMGFNMITYLAALNGIPEELNEAAIIDGAGAWKRFINITLPVISPTTFFLLISTIIWSFQNFAPIQVLTKGGPGEASTTFSIRIIQLTFDHQRVAYATSLSIYMLIIILIITVIQWKGQKRWVNY
jgi:multiple sugar transport system permease protein